MPSKEIPIFGPDGQQTIFDSPFFSKNDEPIHDPTEPMLQFFEYRHLPPALAEVSKCFAQLAGVIIATLPRNPERTVALRKLLESKDCAVRASIYKENP